MQAAYVGSCAIRQTATVVHQTPLKDLWAATAPPSPSTGAYQINMLIFVYQIARYALSDSRARSAPPSSVCYTFSKSINYGPAIRASPPALGR